jgi:hypothetical protein
MTAREIIGLVLLVAGSCILPLGWIVSHKILFVSILLIGVGVWLFYTERMHKQEEQLEKESTGSGSSGPGVPSDIHNYTGWRTGGRTQPLDSFSSEGDSDAD